MPLYHTAPQLHAMLYPADGGLCSAPPTIKAPFQEERSDAAPGPTSNSTVSGRDHHHPYYHHYHQSNLIPDLYQAPFLYFHALDSPPLRPSDLSPAWTDSRGRENKHAARQPSRLGSFPWCPNLLILWHLWERQEEAPPKRGVALQWRRGSFAHREGAPPRDPLCAPSCAWLTFKMCIHIRVCVQPCDPELEYQSTMF